MAALYEKLRESEGIARIAGDPVDQRLNDLWIEAPCAGGDIAARKNAAVPFLIPGSERSNVCHARLGYQGGSRNEQIT